MATKLVSTQISPDKALRERSPPAEEPSAEQTVASSIPARKADDTDLSSEVPAPGPPVPPALSCRTNMVRSDVGRVEPRRVDEDVGRCGTGGGSVLGTDARSIEAVDGSTDVDIVVERADSSNEAAGSSARGGRPSVAVAAAVAATAAEEEDGPPPPPAWVILVGVVSTLASSSLADR